MIDNIKNQLKTNMNLIMSLRKSGSINEKMVKKINDIKINIGSRNVKSLHYSHIHSVKNIARSTCSQAKEFIKAIENEMKTSPLLDKDDFGYIHYMHENPIKSAFHDKRRHKCKRIILFSIILIIFILIILKVF